MGGNRRKQTDKCNKQNSLRDHFGASFGEQEFTLEPLGISQLLFKIIHVSGTFIKYHVASQPGTVDSVSSCDLFENMKEWAAQGKNLVACVFANWQLRKITAAFLFQIQDKIGKLLFCILTLLI